MKLCFSYTCVTLNKSLLQQPSSWKQNKEYFSERAHTQQSYLMCWACVFYFCATSQQSPLWHQIRNQAHPGLIPLYVRCYYQTTPIFIKFKHCLNLTFGIGFVSILAGLSLIEILLTFTNHCSMISLTKWNLTSMYLVLSWKPWFFVKQIALWLSQKTVTFL